LRRRAQDAGVEITSLCLNCHWVFNLASPDVRIRALGVSFLLDAIDLAEEVDAKAILIPGCDQEESPANKWELFRDGVMQGVAKAEQAGVKLALEAVEKPFLYDTSKLLPMVEDCGGSDILGLYLDVGNSTRSALNPADEIRAAQGRAVLVHVKDWDPNQPNERRLGAGAVDFHGSLAALRAIDYNSYLLVELPPDPADPDRVARNSIQFLQELLQE
jgi:sugar phosphate isomerase/epimerase